MTRIQLVDDEPHILSALKRVLRSHDWDIEAFDDATKALAALKETPYDVIVSDYQMPIMDGITYLQFAKQLQPHAIRLIMSAHGDRTAVIKAINQAEIYRFVSKPWEDYEIEAAIRSAVDLSGLQRENRQLLQEVLSQKEILKQRENELLRLERVNPGITRVERDADGSIVIDDTDKY